MKKVGHNSEFFLAFTDELEKQIIKKTVEMGQQKNKIILIFKITHFFKKKIEENTCRYYYQNLDDVIYSSWDIEQNTLKLVILGQFFPLFPLKPPKIKILTNEKICWRYHYFTNVYQKSQSWCTVLDMQNETGRIFCHFGCFFALLHTPPTPNNPKNINFEKNEKHAWRYYPFMHTYVP